MLHIIPPIFFQLVMHKDYRREIEGRELAREMFTLASMTRPFFFFSFKLSLNRGSVLAPVSHCPGYDSWRCHRISTVELSKQYKQPAARHAAGASFNPFRRLFWLNRLLQIGS